MRATRPTHWLTATVITATAACAAELPHTGKIKFDIKQIVNNLNEGCAVADVNNDGTLDIIAGPHWYEGPMWRQHHLRYVREIDNEFMSNNGDHAIDLNGDGWVDVISASWFAHQFYWYQNPGKGGLDAGETWKEHLICENMHTCEGTILEDLDDDGVPELLYSAWQQERPMIVVRIEPGKDGKAPKFTTVTIAEKGNGHGIAAGDINGDGRKDLVTVNGWYEAPANRWTDKWNFHDAFAPEHVSLPSLVVDVNGDGRNDIIAAKGHDYGLFWYEQGPARDGKITWTKHEIDDVISQYHGLYWVDLDGNGKMEIVTGKRWRGHRGSDPGGKDPVALVRYELVGPGKFARDIISYDQGIGMGMQIQTIDFDKDGKLDIAVAGKSGTYVLYNKGTR